MGVLRNKWVMIGLLVLIGFFVWTRFLAPKGN